MIGFSKEFSRSGLLGILVGALAVQVMGELPALRVEGSKMMAGGEEVQLRGLNWGLWHLSATKYVENDMKRQAEWGANVVRLAFSYGDVESEARDGTLREDGVRDIDEVVAWAAKYNQYVILDMHVCPGGQDPAGYCDGGRNLLWKDPVCQERYLSLWRNLALRYRDNPVVGAYELMNEPVTQRSEPSLLVALCKRAVAAIREVDAKKVIVMPADEWSNAKDLRDELVLEDKNVLYTFHFYEGGERVHWLRNESEGRNAKSGTTDWVRFEAPVNATLFDRTFSVMLRSDVNSGTAWFDDVEVVDGAGNVLRKFTFTNGTEGFRPEREPKSAMAHDAAVGHDAPGSLRVANTPEYNGWVFDLQKTYGQAQTYTIRGWLKLENATGRTYACAAMKGIDSAEIDEGDLRRLLANAVTFGKKHNVPLWIGEFAAAKNAGPAGYQINSTRARIRLFEEFGFHWTYWNYRESTHPDSMALHAMDKQGNDYPINQPLLDLLRESFAKNQISTK